MKTKLLFLFFIFLVYPKEGVTQSLDSCFSNYSTKIESLQSKPSIHFLEGTEKFRTTIKSAYQSGVNFAGHYVIASWGCGTACQSHAIINLKNGEARFLPFSTVLGIEYRAESNLLIRDFGILSEEYKDDSLYNHLEAEYYVMREDSLHLVNKVEDFKNCLN